jgi:hypothetical protein
VDVSTEFASFLSHHGDANGLRLSNDLEEDGTKEVFDISVTSGSDMGPDSDSETQDDVPQCIIPKFTKKPAKQMALEKKKANEQDTYDPSACSKYMSLSFAHALICVQAFTITCATQRNNTYSPFTIPSNISLEDLRETVAKK